jgi:hypothetical protein
MPLEAEVGEGAFVVPVATHLRYVAPRTEKQRGSSVLVALDWQSARLPAANRPCEHQHPVIIQLAEVVSDHARVLMCPEQD